MINNRDKWEEFTRGEIDPEQITKYDQIYQDSTKTAILAIVATQGTVKYY